jgi:hypothetical protein
MKYSGTNNAILVGDSVLYAGEPGTIVFIIDDDSYSQEYSKNEWSYLGKGLGVEIQDKEHTPPNYLMLFHLDAPDEDLVFVLR